MSVKTANSSRTVLLVLAMAVALGGCGVRGALEAPNAAGAPPADSAQADSGQGKKEGEASKPHKPFVLDGLLR